MVFLTILGVTEILCSLKLVPERKTGKEMPESLMLEFLETFSGSNLDLSGAQGNTPGPLNRRRYSRFTFVENSIRNLP